MNFFRRVFTNKTSGQKLITIPVKEKIMDGDWVMVSKIDKKLLEMTIPKPRINNVLEVKR